MSENLESKTNHQVILRVQPNFPSNIWKDTHTFTSNVASNHILVFDQMYGSQIEELKDKVKEMLVAATNDPVEEVYLINSLCRLGVSYHFQAEIEVHLKHIFESQHNLGDDNDYDLYTVSLLFRVLRQHGYKMSCSNFNKFKDIDGKFNEILISDAEGMLSLYEAAHLRLHGEDILEEALTFSKAHMIKFLAQNSSPHLTKQIINALELPLHKSMPRLEALKFISFYEQEDSRNETLLLFAKLDFYRVQLLHQQELGHLSSWWKYLELPSKLPYTRDRVTEAYLWAVMIYFEPCYSRTRLMLCKIGLLLTVVDDTYDSYGTMEELRLFTDAVERWDVSALDDLPDYMKIIYSFLLNHFDEIHNDLTEEERYRISHTKDTMKEMFTAYFVEAQWSNQNYVPPFNEYCRNGILTAGIFAYTSSIYLGMGEEIPEKNNAFEWLLSRPRILSAPYEILRLKNDLMGHKFGQAREHVVCSVECYMKEYELTSMKETVENFNLIIENAWKDINQECLQPTPVTMDILSPVVNFARLAEVTYNDRDSYTYPQYFKDIISALFIDQIPI